MKRADLWVTLVRLCEQFPGGVEVVLEDHLWRCRVRTPEGVVTGTAKDIGGAVEVVAHRIALAEPEELLRGTVTGNYRTHANDGRVRIVVPVLDADGRS